MALERPTILLAQTLNEVPFDIREMETLVYHRQNLTRTLKLPLGQMVLDTIAAHVDRPGTEKESDPTSALVKEVIELKNLVGQMVSAWGQRESLSVQLSQGAEWKILEGAWIDEQSETHLYATNIGGKILAAYCFGGDYRLTGVHNDWRRVGDYYFGRFFWVDDLDFSGFAFLRAEGPDEFRGAWWLGEDYKDTHEVPAEKTGIRLTFKRHPEKSYPDWASNFFHSVRECELKGGLDKLYGGRLVR
jgi:hypothetical protein